MPGGSTPVSRVFGFLGSVNVSFTMRARSEVPAPKLSSRVHWGTLVWTWRVAWFEIVFDKLCNFLTGDSRCAAQPSSRTTSSFVCVDVEFDCQL